MKNLLEKRWLTPDDVYELYKIKTKQQSKLRCKSSKIKIPFIKVGKFVRYDRYDLDLWFENHKVITVA